MLIYGVGFIYCLFFLWMSADCELGTSFKYLSRRFLKNVGFRSLVLSIHLRSIEKALKLPPLKAVI